MTHRWPGVKARRRLVPELVREQIGRMVDDLLATTRARLQAHGAARIDDVRRAGRAMAAFSDTMAADVRCLKQFLHAAMYRAPAVARLRDPSEKVVEALFAALRDDPRQLPGDWAASCPADEPARARHIGDFVAGMTDRYALRLYRQLVGTLPPGLELAPEGALQELL